jgi:hypothetical protein
LLESLFQSPFDVLCITSDYDSDKGYYPTTDAVPAVHRFLVEKKVRHRFSILLPGSLLTWLLMGEVGPVVLGDRYAKLAGAEAWAAFLFASYLLGHLVFLLGSWLDEIYDLFIDLDATEGCCRRFSSRRDFRRSRGTGSRTYICGLVAAPRAAFLSQRGSQELRQRI